MNPTDMAVPSADNDVLGSYLAAVSISCSLPPPGDDYYGPDGLPDERRRVRNRQKSVTYRENKKVELKHLKVEATELFMKCSKTFAIAKVEQAYSYTAHAWARARPGALIDGLYISAGLPRYRIGRAQGYRPVTSSYFKPGMACAMLHPSCP
jgi:hypothetical protein